MPFRGTEHPRIVENYGIHFAHSLVSVEENNKKYHRYTQSNLGPDAKAAVPALMAIQNESLIGPFAKEALAEINRD